MCDRANTMGTENRVLGRDGDGSIMTTFRAHHIAQDVAEERSRAS